MTRNGTHLPERWGTAIAACAAALAICAVPVAADQQRGDAAAAGMRRVRDRGAASAGAVQAEPSAEEARAARGDAGELRAEPVEAPAGGVKLNLRGRFRAAVGRQAAPEDGRRHSCDGGQGSAHE